MSFEFRQIRAEYRARVQNFSRESRFGQNYLSLQTRRRRTVEEICHAVSFFLSFGAKVDGVYGDGERRPYINLQVNRII